MLIPYRLDNIDEIEGMIDSVMLRCLDDDSTIDLKIDHLLLFFGLVQQTQIFQKFGLNLDENNRVIVNSINMQTNLERIFAVGDIVNYGGKLKLILSGFSEAATACHGMYKYVFPDKELVFQYSTNTGIPE